MKGNGGSATARLASLHLQTSLAMTTRRKDIRNMRRGNIGTSRQPDYRPVKVVGKGAFGVVYCARTPDGSLVAIKKVLQNPQYKDRELEIMQMVRNRYCIILHNAFKSMGRNPKEIYLNLVMDYLPSSLHEVVMNYRHNSKYPPLFFVKLYGFQIFAGLAYLHSIGVTHRDIKPENLLVDTESGELKICDFGSAKVLHPGEQSVCYIASRYYRAPELLFNCTTYTTSIDVWAAGCVVAEMLCAGMPLFVGSSNLGMISEIVKVIGPPTEDDMSLYEHSVEIGAFPHQVTTLERKLPGHTTPDLIDLLKRIFVYDPRKRLTARECLNHPFFDDLFQPGLMMRDGRPLPVLDRS